MRLVILFTIIFLKTSLVNASVITFERGGISDSPGIVDKNSLQMELGTVTYERSLTNSKDYNYDFLSPLFRYGLASNRFELRLQSRGLSLNRQDLMVHNIAPGFKLRILDEDKFLPSLQLISGFNIPLQANNGYQSNFSHFHKFVINKALNDKLNFLVNLSLNFESYDLNSNREFASVTLPYVFNLNYALSDRLTLLAEIFGSWALSNKLGSNLGLAYGATYALKDNLVFDLTNYWGLNDATNDFGITTGLSYRF